MLCGVRMPSCQKRLKTALLINPDRNSFSGLQFYVRLKGLRNRSTATEAEEKQEYERENFTSHCS